MNPSLPPVQFEQAICAGGLDQVTPTLSLKNGVARFSINFEVSPTGGYSRVNGYERFDGHPGPTDNATGIILSVTAIVNAPAVGNVLTASGGASGTVAWIDGVRLGVTKISGTFVDGDVLSAGATTIGTVDNTQAGPVTPREDAEFRGACADIYRTSILAVPGSGAIRGVVFYNDVTYAFRDNAGATACDIYKSSATGWVNVPFYKTISFTAGGATAPADGATLTQGGVTATIKRVVRTSGAWTGTAAGQFIITTPAGGNFAAGAATIGTVNVTLSGAQTAVTLLPGGKFEFFVNNFKGQSATSRIYGCDGKNKAFEFDGDILVPLTTGATTDTPAHITGHRNFLFLAIGSSIIYSAPGDPYDYTAVGGSAEIATGSDITAMASMPGSTENSTLGIFSRDRTNILYGTGSTTFNLVRYEDGTGAVPFSAKSLAQTLTFDDSGVISIQASLQYGNFAQTSLSESVGPFVRERLNKCTCASVNRARSQYRVFFNDGYGLFVTVVNGKLKGSMPVYFPDVVRCCFDGRKSTGDEVLFFGSDDGFVYQFDKGSSFDGDEIEWLLTLNYASARNPRVLKRWRKASVEVASNSIASGSNVSMQIGYVLGYDSIEYEQAGQQDYAQYLSSGRWDSFVWDNFFWDSSGSSPLEVELLGTAENIALAFSGSSDIVNQFTINSIIMHYTPRRAMR